MASAGWRTGWSCLRAALAAIGEQAAALATSVEKAVPEASVRVTAEESGGRYRSDGQWSPGTRAARRERRRIRWSGLRWAPSA